MPLLETADVAAPIETQPSLVHALNNVLLRAVRSLVFRTDDHTPLFDLPIAQVRCLNAIGNDEGRKMQEIAARLDIKLPAMSQIVDRLVKKGLVERRDDPTDRRVARLHLTDYAKELIGDARAARLTHLSEAVSRMDEETVRRVIEDLAALAEAGESLHLARSSKYGTASVATTPLDGHDPLVEMIARRTRSPRRIK